MFWGCPFVKKFRDTFLGKVDFFVKKNHHVPEHIQLIKEVMEIEYNIEIFFKRCDCDTIVILKRLVCDKIGHNIYLL